MILPVIFLTHYIFILNYIYIMYIYIELYIYIIYIYIELYIYIIYIYIELYIYIIYIYIELYVYWVTHIIHIIMREHYFYLFATLISNKFACIVITCTLFLTRLKLGNFLGKRTLPYCTPITVHCFYSYCVLDTYRKT